MGKWQGGIGGGGPCKSAREGKSGAGCPGGFGYRNVSHYCPAVHTCTLTVQLD